MRRRAALAGLVAAVLTTAACGGAAEEPGEPELDPAKLTVYSSQHENVTQAWVDAYTAKTGQEVQIHGAHDRRRMLLWSDGG